MATKKKNTNTPAKGKKAAPKAAPTKTSTAKAEATKAEQPKAAAPKPAAPKAVPKAPGMKYRHYAPKGRIAVLRGGAEFWRKALETRPEPEASWVFILTDEKKEELAGLLPEGAKIYSLGSRAQLGEAAARLFSALREMDDEGVAYAFAEDLPREGIGEAVMNRLLKAAGGDLRTE